tara:strand:- start:61 stop:435 length:375 start_codon:yes stop_codon:yes gene_type:complete
MASWRFWKRIWHCRVILLKCRNFPFKKYPKYRRCRNGPFPTPRLFAGTSGILGKITAIPEFSIFAVKFFLCDSSMNFVFVVFPVDFSREIPHLIEFSSYFIAALILSNFSERGGRAFVRNCHRK